jgi:hypothetical protein
MSSKHPPYTSAFFWMPSEVQNATADAPAGVFSHSLNADANLGAVFDTMIGLDFGFVGLDFDTALGTGFDTALGTGFNTALGTGFNTALGTGFDTALGTGFNTALGTGFDTALGIVTLISILGGAGLDTTGAGLDTTGL